MQNKVIKTINTRYEKNPEIKTSNTVKLTIKKLQTDDKRRKMKKRRR